jgi:hypothetical protein
MPDDGDRDDREYGASGGRLCCPHERAARVGQYGGANDGGSRKDEADCAEQANREALGAPADQDGLRRTVGFDDVPYENADKERN